MPSNAWYLIGRALIFQTTGQQFDSQSIPSVEVSEDKMVIIINAHFTPPSALETTLWTTAQQ